MPSPGSPESLMLAGRVGPLSRRVTRPDCYPAQAINGRASMVLFIYQIVPAGDHARQILATGSLYIADVESAKRYVQTVTVPGGYVPKVGSEVILQDLTGLEIWRGPYLGEHFKEPETTRR